VLINDQPPFVFIHAWRTGGTSIERALAEASGSARRSSSVSLRGKLRFLTDLAGLTHGRFLGKHAFAHDVSRHLPPGRFGDYYSFGFVRNPWDWLVSWFHFVQDTTVSPDTGRPWRHHLHRFVGDMDFDEFVRWVVDIDGLTRAHARLQSSFRHKRPFLQLDWFSDLRGEVIVTRVGRFETLAEDFASIAGELGLPGIELPHINAAKPHLADYRRYYSPEDAERVGRYFGADIQAFGYEF
jgi:hypothetical protein